MSTAVAELVGVRMSAEAESLPLIEFVAPLPGFPQHREFALVRLDDDGLLYALSSAQDPDLRFLVVPPGPFFPDYGPEVDDETIALLDADPADLLILLVVTANDGPGSAPAPVTGSGLPVRASLSA